MHTYKVFVSGSKFTNFLSHAFSGFSWFLPICQNQIQGLLKNFQEPYKGYIKRTKLNQNGTFISTYKQVARFSLHSPI